MRAGSVKELFMALNADNWVIDLAITFAREIDIPVILVRFSKKVWQCLWDPRWHCSRCNCCTVVFVYKTQRLCFYPKNEPPGCVVLTRNK